MSLCGFCGVSLALGEPVPLPSPGRVLIIGHRGGSETAAENTLAALRSGYADGADGCELDFRSTADGVLVVSHDSNMKRCAGMDVEIASQTFEELRKLDVGRWGKWKDKGISEKIPTLDEALATVPPKRKIFLHCYTGRLEIGKVRDAVLRSGLKPEQVVLICFERGPCVTFKKLLPHCKTYWLVTRKRTLLPLDPKLLDNLVQQAQSDGIDGLDLQYQFPIDKTFVDKMHGLGLELHVWTVDDAGPARRLAECGVDSITTDRAAWLRQQLDAKK